MPTGTRNVAFINKGEGKLEPRIVELGSKYGDSYEVKTGLREGEQVIASANFLIDAESKVQQALKEFEPTPFASESPSQAKP
jgi:Cu(I)/Ag(I) efflux system membrane fusion protein